MPGDRGSRRRFRRGLALSDLSGLARLYVIGRCGDDLALAEAVVRMLFQEDFSQRRAAREHGVARRTLQRKAGSVRRGLDRLISSGRLSVTDLIAKG